jgi:hypothetical protein
MFENYFEIIEIIFLFISFPFFLKLFNAIEYSVIFKKGYTAQVQIIFVVSVFIFSALFAGAITHVMEIFYHIIS